MDLTRRLFLKSSGIGLLALGLPPSFLVRAAAEEAKKNKVLVVVFQRGGMDGLNAVIPFKDRAYYALRPTIAVGEPGSGADRAVDLDGFYGFHPALAPLKPLFAAGRLAVVHAAGSPDNSRSHFDAQDYMETGTPGVKSIRDGWLNRLLQDGAAGGPLRAAAITFRMPRILAGDAPALTLTSVEEFRLRDPLLAPALEQRYANVSDPLLRKSAAGLFDAMRTLQAAGASAAPPSKEAYPNGRFGASLKQIAALVKSKVGLQIAFTEADGWDTHVGEGGASGQMANRLKDFADGLAAFARDLGDHIEDVVVVTLSEFGRTARENGNRGTDHGHGNVMFVLGGKVKGGKVYGRWPGLDPAALYEGRDLALTTDFRAVCGEVLARHLGRTELGKIFPAYRPPAPLGIVT
ncbi:MAG TPA: DUF1501 domain-containing protein [Candidatus Binatia bacterium]|jgi:uncharacterized protein (DUF1501 family)